MTTRVTLIGDGAVNSSSIFNGTVNSEDLNSTASQQAVTTDTIRDGAVTATKLQSSASNNTQRAVGTNHIQDGAVTSDKLSSSYALVPLGGIIMWSGTTTPDGWQLCNGSNLPSTSPLRPDITKTPDLRNRFIVGATSGGDGVYPGVDIGQIGGSANATLVSHSHTGTTVENGAHSHKIMWRDSTANYGTGAGYSPEFVTDWSNANAGSGTAILEWAVDSGPVANHNHTFTTSTEGSSATNANLPPYYALAFIIRVL